MANPLQVGAGANLRNFSWAMAVFCLASFPVIAADGVADLSDQDKICLACHSQEGFNKDLGKGKKMSLNIKGDDFAKSVHGAIGCAGCHSDVSLDKHPGNKKIPSTREYSIGATQVCQGCHEDKAKLYEGSIHAAMLRAGNRAAPVCVDCHSPHSVKPKSVTDTITGLSCKKCHEPIFNAYAESMHGQARGKLGHVEAPICADCHRAHDVTAPSVGTHLKDACLSCHTGAVETHRVWLPNAGRHLEAVSCPACHAPAAQRRVDLRLSETGGGNGAAEFGESARAAVNGLDAESLWNLLRKINQNGGQGKASLQGRLEVRTGVEAHQLADKSRAIRDCNSCHSDGADPFQNVIVSVIGPDGRPVRFSTDKGVLSSLMSVGSVSGFYAIGGTRVKLLDVLLGVVFIGAVSVPVGHLSMKWFIRRRERKNAEQRANS